MNYYQQFTSIQKNESETIPFEKDLIGEISYGIGERIMFEIRSKVPKKSSRL